MLPFETTLLLAVVVLTTIGALCAAVLLRRRPPVIDLSFLTARFDSIERAQERQDRTLREEIALGRSAAAEDSRRLREELSALLRSTAESLITQLAKLGGVQNEQLSAFSSQIAGLTALSERKLGEIRETVDGRLRSLQEDNAIKLDQMRATVDEKLQSTLERRLGESFKIVSEQLEQVHRGLGEMQSLAIGVGDLKKVLTNVKSRGTWGEVQLGAILEQVLGPQQYQANVNTTGDGREVVEYAIRLPGNGENPNEPLWLPIDSKFPIEDYVRLHDAQEAGDASTVDVSGRQLEAQVELCAKTICDKYIAPPKTTNFAIMFLPTEGLYAEVIRRTALVDKIQRNCHIVVAGPTTLFAILNSLQMGFRTLAIQKRSSEVWTVLGGVKTEFEKFGTVIEKVGKKLQEASNSVSDVGKRTRAIERHLRQVEALPVSDGLLGELPVLSAEVANLPISPLDIESQKESS